MSLTPCTGCARHVRVSERRCPFCHAALSLSHTPARPTPTQRLGRGALFAFGASVASAMGCGQATTADVGVSDASIGMPSDGGTDACIGCFDAGYGGAPDMGHDAFVGSFDAAYGSADFGPRDDAYGCPDTNF